MSIRNTGNLRFAVAQMFVRGKTPQYIAKTLHLSVKMVKEWRQDSRVQDLMSDLESIDNQVIESRLKYLRTKAINVLFSCLESDNPKDYQWAVSKVFELYRAEVNSIIPVSAPLPISEEDEKPVYEEVENLKPIRNRGALMRMLQDSKKHEIREADSMRVIK